MKLILSKKQITLKPENYADKLYLADYMKDAEEKVLNNMELTFKYSEDYCERSKKGGGYCDPNEVVNSIYEACIENDEERGLVAVDEITELEIYNYEF